MLFLTLFLLCQPAYLGESGNYIIIAACTVGNQAAGAVLDSLIGIGKTAPALVSQGIQGTIAEHAVKIAAV